MMLQGHFMSHTLADYSERRAHLGEIHDVGDILFMIWFHLRGLTAPLFFTITGVVFVYLLLGGDKTQTFFQQKRVRKGIKRACTIILIGYFLQLNYQNIDYYLAGKVNQRFYGFHVLQSIGTGILVLLSFYGVFLLSKLKHFSLILMIGGASIFLATPFIESFGSVYLPRNAHPVIQNIIHGPNSFFPLFPWLGFVLFGGAIGAILREFQSVVREKSFPVKFILSYSGVIAVFLGGVYILEFFVSKDVNIGRIYYSCFRLLEVALFITILMYADRFSKGRESTFIKMGQNTLIIYVLHVMLLYGAVIGVGLTRWFGHALSFGWSIFGAVLFVLIFAVLIKYLEPINAFIDRIKRGIKAPFVKAD